MSDDKWSFKPKFKHINITDGRLTDEDRLTTEE